ncbi:JmjC domain-containing protein [Arthrobacter sp. NPDC055585]
MIDTRISTAAWQELADLGGPLYGLNKPFISRGVDRFVEEFPSANDVLSLLAATWIPKGGIEVTGADKKVIPQSSYALALDDAGDMIKINLDAINQCLDGGATVFLSKLDTSLPSLAAPGDCNLPTAYSSMQIFAFITSPGTESYSVHHDLLDSLIVQVEGVKSWQAWDRRKGVRPGDGYVLYKAEGLGEPDIDTDLNVGDVVLLPANAPHIAGTTHSSSFHLAVAFRES